jgi:hypothetical protein
MNVTDILTEKISELDYRSADGIDVWLLWARSSNRVLVVLVDTRLSSTFELDVDPADALDAFRHPYAYAATAGGRACTLV